MLITKNYGILVVCQNTKRYQCYLQWIPLKQYGKMCAFSKRMLFTAFNPLFTDGTSSSRYIKQWFVESQSVIHVHIDLCTNIIYGNLYQHFSSQLFLGELKLILDHIRYVHTYCKISIYQRQKNCFIEYQYIIQKTMHLEPDF